MEDNVAEADEVAESTENLDPIPETGSTENEVEESSPQPQVDYEGKIKALEEQYERALERSRYLEQTARLQEEALKRVQQPRETPSGSSLSKEMEELDKTLEPLFERRLKAQTQPLLDSVSRMYDESDQTKFELYLMRNHPEVFEQDGGLNSVLQEVEGIRQRAAQQYGQWISRSDAFLFREGISGVREKVKTRAAKKTSQVREEAKRLQTVRATGSGTGAAPVKKDPGADIQNIRAKAGRGERLTDAERAKYKDFIADQAF